MVSTLRFPEPPTKSSLSEVRAYLQQSLGSLESLSKKITEAEDALQKTILQAQRAIEEMRSERETVENQALHARFYLAPVRLLPQEILRDVFETCFEQDPCIAWVLGSVSRSWRSLALSMPKIWSKIRLRTTDSSSPDTIRLWLERTGRSVPLDIEISLRNQQKSTSNLPNTSRPSRQFLGPFLQPATPLVNGHAPHFIITPGGSIHSPYDNPLRSFSDDDEVVIDCEQGSTAASRNRTHWGHIVFSYLVDQMHRWERFVFRFDAHFPSITSLRTIFGDAPLLREFEVSAASEALYTSDWYWLPNMDFSIEGWKGGTNYTFPNLRSLTLQLVPFRSTSPLLMPGLHTLNLYSLSHSPGSLDRVLHVLRVSKATLQCISLYLREATRPIIPLTPLTLPELKELSIGGHQSLTEILEVLTVPSLEELNVDIYPHSIQQTVSSLISRSGSAAAMRIKHLSIGYGFGCGYAASKANRFVPQTADVFGGRGSHIIGGGGGWRTTLDELPHLQSLRVADEASPHLLDILNSPENHNSLHMMPPLLPAMPPQTVNWVCPHLIELGIKGFNLQGTIAPDLVRLIESRNPAGGGHGTTINSVTPKRLSVVELFECLNARQDVKDWFESRVQEVVFTEPFQSRLNGTMQHPFA